MLKQVNTIFILNLLLICMLTGHVRAEQKPFRLMLFSGTVTLLDKHHQRIPARIGLNIESTAYHSLELSAGSRAYLQRGTELLQLEKAGIYPITELERKPGSILTNTLRFLAALSKPRTYTRQTKARGRQETGHQEDPAYFEEIWENVALHGETHSEPMAEEDVLATAAWFHQHGEAVRTAYILEYLDNTSKTANPFFHKLRNDSLRGIQLAAINKEVEKTRQAVRRRTRQFRYRALLIGIDRYDHPAWQPLDTPVADVRSIRKTLIEFYHFQPGDITTLENPTFSEIIDGFQDLKKEVDDHTRLIIYFAGHGYYPADEEEGYWIPRDGGDPETQELFIPTSIILSKMKAIKSRHTLLITDSCFSGSLIRKSRGAVVDSGFYRELSSKRSRQIITSGGLEPVSDSGRGEHSVFAGSLLQILSTKRESPLSASELAIELRKSLKNTGVQQTPEYGRLYAADDESGEFFFVRKDQSLAYAERQPQISTAPIASEDEPRELDIIGMHNPPPNDGSAFQARGSEDWLSIGVLFHLGFLEYNYLYSTQGIPPEKINISATMEGTGLKAEARRTSGKGSYGVSFDFGQFIRLKTCANHSNDAALSGIGFNACDEEDQESDEAHTSLSGYFTHLGLFTDYSVLVWRELSIQLGGTIQYQYYQLTNFLEADSLNSSTLGACGNGGVSFRKSGWTVRFLFDLCLAAFEISGSLHELKEDYVSDVRLMAGMTMGMGAGFQF